jgi:hypothetical protein
MARIAVQTRPSPALHADSIGLLPIRCLYRLMQRRMFVRHNVNPGPWVFAQVIGAGAGRVADGFDAIVGNCGRATDSGRDNPRSRPVPLLFKRFWRPI